MISESKSLLLFLLTTLCSLACGPLTSDRVFTVSAWESASKDERRQMAKDFLRKHDTNGMNVEQLKQLLGRPDYERDVWWYHLSLNGAAPPGAQTNDVFLNHPQLYIRFKDGVVDEVLTTHGLVLKNDLSFSPKLWKAAKPPDRMRMAAGLVNAGVLKALSKDEVRDQLGEPNGQSERREIHYDLGKKMIDMVTLTFTLDAEGRVAEANIVED